MTRAHRTIVTATFLVGAAGVAIGVTARDTDHEIEVTLEECPATVQVTILAHLNGGTIMEIERTTDHGEVLYEVDVRVADGVIEFDVAADGAFRRFENDGQPGVEEVQIRLRDTPRAVRRAFDAIALRADVYNVERIVRDGVTMYEIDYETNGSTAGVVMSANGDVMELESVVPVTELPETVLDALLDAFPGSSIAEAESVQLFFYEVELELDGRTREVIVFANGRIRDRDDDDHDDHDGHDGHDGDDHD